MIKYEEIKITHAGFLTVFLRGFLVIMVAALISITIDYVTDSHPIAIKIIRLFLSSVTAITLVSSCAYILISYERPFFNDKFPFFDVKTDGYKIVGLDLEITSIKTPYGEDIKNTVTNSEMLEFADKFYLEVENYPQSDFVLVRNSQNSDMINSIIEIYRNDGKVGIELDDKHIGSFFLKFTNRLENMSNFNILNNRIYDFFKIKEI